MPKKVEHIFIDGIECKQCNKCGQKLPATKEYFFTRSVAKDGLFSDCKVCNGYEYKKPSKAPREGFKICVRCGEELPATAQYFRRYSRSSDGLQSKCKKCANKYNIENKEKLVVKQHEKYLKNKNHYLEKAKEHYQQNKDKILKYHKKYDVENTPPIIQLIQKGIH